MINKSFDIQEQILRVSLLKEGTKMNRRKDFSSTLPCCTNGAVCTNTNRYAQDSWAAPTREKGHCAKSFLSSRPRLNIASTPMNFCGARQLARPIYPIKTRLNRSPHHSTGDCIRQTSSEPRGTLARGIKKEK